MENSKTNNLISRIKARANADKNTAEKKSPDSLILRIKRRNKQQICSCFNDKINVFDISVDIVFMRTNTITSFTKASCI